MMFKLGIWTYSIIDRPLRKVFLQKTFLSGLNANFSFSLSEPSSLKPVLLLTQEHQTFQMQVIRRFQKIRSVDIHHALRVEYPLLLETVMSLELSDMAQ